MTPRFTQKDKEFLQKAIVLAKRGLGFVSPNPMVGAVVVKDDEIVGTGFHRKFGGDHAEVEALREAGHLARGAVLYCTLEPCSHYGKTPPCVDRVIDAGIQKVILGSVDPNHLVNGRGIKILREHGIIVESGLLEKSCRELNETYFKHITTNLPFLTLKAAQSLDSNIADHHGHSHWISNEPARQLVHRWRWQSDAVMIGIGTALQDDPSLTVRHEEGPQPYRIILDSHLRIPLTAKLLNDSFVEKTIFVISLQCKEYKKQQEIEQRGAKVWRVEQSNFEGLHWLRVLEKIGHEGIASVLVEGGRRIFSSLLDEQLADRLAVFIAPLLLGDGLPAFQGLRIGGFSQAITLEQAEWHILGNNALVIGKIQYPKVNN